MAQELDDDATFALRMNGRLRDVTLSQLVPKVTSITSEIELNILVDSMVQGWYEYMHEVRAQVLRVYTPFLLLILVGQTFGRWNSERIV
jgi:hypothetical protein